MSKRYVSIWFSHLLADWHSRQQPELKEQAFVLALPERGRMIVKAESAAAKAKGIQKGMVVADCRAIYPELKVIDHEQPLTHRLLRALAVWCLRFTPIAAIDAPDGVILDATGCPHLWGGEEAYLKDITGKLTDMGYQVRAAMADTVGAAWANARYGRQQPVIPSGEQMSCLLPLPPLALRLEETLLTKLNKLGFYQIRQFIHLPRHSLRRRFGETLLQRLDQALGQTIEPLQPVQPVVPYQERLPSLEPIRTAKGIEIALKKLLEQLCKRLEAEGKGLRKAIFSSYRIDGETQQIAIGTSRASRHAAHLYRLFELKTGSIAPGLGIELFLLEAPVTEDIHENQETLWRLESKHKEQLMAELLDRLAGRAGMQSLQRYLPAEHYWPERMFRQARTLDEKATTAWR